MLHNFTHTSIGRKQVVATTGLMLILFVIGHLAGNLIIFLGPEAFNAYAHKLASLRPFLYVIESGLFFIFIIHMYFTALLVWNNIQARGTSYKVSRQVGNRSLATRLMPYTGIIIFIFVIVHLLDFTFMDKTGPKSFLPDGKSYELYGVVINAFGNIAHDIFYIVAMIAVGMHLHHGVESFIQTFGFSHPTIVPIIKKISHWTAVFVTIAFSAIPIYAYYLYTHL